MTTPPISITGSMLYDLIACPHRVAMDLFEDPAKRDDVSPFVQLLWDRGAVHEDQIVAGLSVPYLDLSKSPSDEREMLTLAAMDLGEGLIYGGQISAGDLLGAPDFLRKESNGYVAGDIKSGSGDEGGDDEETGKPKKHYAVQLGLYTDILEKMGRSAGRRAFVIDIKGKEVIYDFNVVLGAKNPHTLWDDYVAALNEAREISSRGKKTIAAYSSGICKNCVWYSSCIKALEDSDDLTLIPEVGRSKRDVIYGYINTVHALSEIDPDKFIKGKKTEFPGIGPATLKKMCERAKLLTSKNPKPYLRAPISLPAFEVELFFDIEVDPMRGHCYLHGFVERRGGGSEKFVAFFAEDPTDEAEEAAFSAAWNYMHQSQPCGIYYYSKYERTIYRKLQAKYPNVCTAEEVAALFDPSRAVDLYYDVVLKATEWPTHDYSIKTLAKFLGFKWRDLHPSGAASIEWFDRWTKTKDPKIKQRILDYNEDDCRATRALLDGIREMTV